MAFYQTVVEAGQDIYDLAIQEYGSVEAIFLLFEDNPELDLVTELEIGQEIKVRKEPDSTLVESTTQMNFFRTRQIRIVNAGFPESEQTDLRDHDEDHDEDHN